MIKGIEGSAERYLVDLSRIQDTQVRVQQELASGLRVNRSSDAPENVMNILQLRSDIERSTTVDKNLGRIKSEVDTAEAAMQIAVKLVERARVLAAEAATSGATNRKGSGIEAEQLHAQLVALTGTTSEGRYIFSGDLENDLLYEVDTTQSAGVNRRASASNTRMIEDVNGTRFGVSRSAHQIFDARDDDGIALDENAFQAVHELTLALQADDMTAVQAAMPKITAALDHLNRELTFYGHTQNRLASATTTAKKAILDRTKELSLAQDTDVTEALVRLNTSSVHHQVALAAHAQLPRTTLFDFLG